MRVRFKVPFLDDEVVDYCTVAQRGARTILTMTGYIRLTKTILLRYLGWRKHKRDDHTMSYADALGKAAFDSVETIVRKRRILFAGFIARVGEERLPERVMFRELLEGKVYSAAQEIDCLVHLK